MTQPLYTWQEKALGIWDELTTQKMTVAAVTGSGKTRVATEIIDRWIALHTNKPWQVTIIVPGRALMVQWGAELSRSVGRIGGGSIKGWAQAPDPHLNIATIQSMSQGKTGFIGDGAYHLVIVDECHNLRGQVYRKAMDIPHVATLGLSATPHPDAEAQKVVSGTCGPILVRYRYAEALKDGVVPPFRLVAVEIPLTVDERAQYVKLTKRIGKAMKRIDFGSDAERRKAREEVKRLARERKMRLNRCEGRFDKARALLNKHADQPTLLFHERTEDVDRLAEEMAHLAPAVYHSNRRDAAEQFRRFNDRDTNHLFSCLSITEGFNAPFVEVAIMMSGPNAPLRRIQTLGRCLRGRTDRPNEIYFLYVAGTTDERGLRNLIEAADIPPDVIVQEDGTPLPSRPTPQPWLPRSSRRSGSSPKAVSRFGKTEGRPTLRELMDATFPSAHPDDMTVGRDGVWTCNWCDLELNQDGTVDLGDWARGANSIPHFLSCLECENVAPDCQGLACEHGPDPFL